MAFEKLAKKIADLGGIKDGKRITPARQKALAKLAGGSLPPALRWLWTTYGGGWTFTGYVHYPDPKSGKLVMIGWAMDAGEVADAIDSWGSAMPPHRIPIINDGADNIHTVDLRDGSVNIHVNYGAPKVRDYRLAGSVEKFVLGLQVKDDE